MAEVESTRTLTYEDLLAACRAGGASVLTSVTELRPAVGEHGAVAPARYISGRVAAYAFETRYVDGQAVRVVLIDGKASSLNRMEDGLLAGIREGASVLRRLPRIEVTYESSTVSDLELPHRAFDGHVRAGTIEGSATTQVPAYRALRDCTPANARALLETSPVSIVFGAWDSSRRSNQVRFPSAIRGEIIGVLADQTPGAEVSKRGGARKDDLTPSVQLVPTELKALVDAQRDELSPKLTEKIDGAIAKAKKGARLSGSPLGLGAIPPTLETLGLVSCRRIIRSHVLSFATLRQLRFGGTPEGDASCRALLAALALDGMARADAELQLRANCDLTEAAEPVVTLDQRYGRSLSLEPITIEVADALLVEALEAAEAAAGVAWQGQILEIVGNPSVMHSATDDSDDDAQE